MTKAEAGALATDDRWTESRFGELEAFILEFLMGGARAGERVRLKLETPLFVTDALLDAARQQLENELATATEVGAALGIEAHRVRICH